MKPDNETRLRHILDAALEAMDFSKELTVQTLPENRMAVLAILRSLEIIGEAAAHITPEFQSDHPEIPWEKITGMRNRLIHAYFDIDYDTVWSTVKSDLPVLIEQLKKVIDD
jgi:uncharacterized protein with HEPN domain